ncbi:M15 family metallopeptidase [Lentzea cavernae]|uniref:Uncharacterized protein n=1 Tax=Lentzea cavernae TaxID=2020703 RepID=A0ABQ3M7H8_9PSEU|nr:M15 family metallopeptidase [Lentzea cavernae]GHH35715.1 hypothetical protein GCM10017774_21380 [Lentzea cavernae]
MTEHVLGRRRFLGIAGVAAAATTVGFAPVASAAPTASANGWPLGHRDVVNHRIEGSGATIALRSGDVATVLLHVARRYNYEIATVELAHVSQVAGGAPFETNYASGTAFALRPDLYPLGVKGNLFPTQLVVLRDVLAECEGVVRWGGDFKKSPKEGHFQIDVRPGSPKLAMVARKINGLRQDKAAGAPPEAFAKARTAVAEALARRQIATG